MLQLAFDVAQWAIYVAGAIAVAALVVLGWRAARTPRRFSISAAVALIVAGGVCFASYEFLGTRVQQVTLGSITQLGLEKNHAGLRTNALVYGVPVNITASWCPLPSFMAGCGVVRDLDHKTTTVQSKIAVYGLIDFTKLAGEKATVNRQTKVITLSLPDPEVGPNTTYIMSVDGIQQHSGVVSSIAQSLVGPFEALFHHSNLSLNTAPELAKAESAALAQGQRSVVLSSCGKREIEQQLTAAFDLTPAYAGYTVDVTWPQPPAPGVNCAAMQQKLTGNGS
ncbi:MAG TPA: hypothetical protein VHZ03_33610 [Trebonia sp.]|nr:hypothetical protein [Trebonia sp.]